MVVYEQWLLDLIDEDLTDWLVTGQILKSLWSEFSAYIVYGAKMCELILLYTYIE